ncbi:MAG: tetratricopeptide repeat protein [Planctomycetota bacterium]|jgi:tetratricopeptide (TPR) repeat protein
MKVKTNNVKSNSSIENRAVINVFRVLCFSFVSLCFLTSLVNAQIQSEQLSPTDFLMPYLEKSLQNANTPTVQMQDAKLSPIDFLMPYLAQTLQDANTPTVQMQAAKLQPTGQEKPQTSDIEAVNFVAKLNQKMPQIDSAIPGNLSSNPGRQLWRAGISVYEGEKDSKSKNKLKRLIEQVRAIEFKSPKKPEPFITIAPVPTTVEPNETPAEVEINEKTEKQTIESKPPYMLVTDRTLQMLGNITQDPNQLDNPFELGEVLYFSGHLKEAAVFYQEALNRTDPEKTGADRNRAWILFQIGNCLQDYDLPAAKKVYIQLITEHPNSPWVELAKAREKLIDWYLKDKPRTLITEPKL